MKTSPQEDKKKTILEAARRLLVRRGFQDDAVALDEVARLAKVAKGTLFLYYRNKDELFQAAFADLVESLAEQLETVAASPLRGRARLEEIVRVVIEYFDRHRDFLSQAARFPGCRIAENHARMVRLLKTCAADGLFADSELGPAASALFGLCRSAIFYKLITGKDETLETRVRRVTDMFLHGVAGRR